MKDLDSAKIIETIKNIGVNIYYASTTKEDIYFVESQLKEYLRLIEEYSIKVVFVDIIKFSEEEIEENIIAEENIVGDYRRRILGKELQEYNQYLEEMKKFIGKDKEINLFFSHQGIIYSCMLFNDDLEIYPRSDFLADLCEKYDVEIEDAREIAVQERAQELGKYFAKIQDYLMKNEAFHKCKNKDLRRAFIFSALREDEELLKLETPHANSKQIMEVVEDVWRKLKLKESSII